MSVEIWHNPRCSKSRETLALIEEHGITPSIRLYLTDSPSEEELRKVLNALGMKAADILRKGEPDYKTAGLSKDSSDDAIISAMAADPRLIERPIVQKGSEAILGRPPETVLDLI